MSGGSENGDVSPRDNGDNTTVTTTQPTTTTTITSSTTSATTATSTSTTTTPTTAAAIHTTTEQVSDHRTVDSDSWKLRKVKRANEKGSSINDQLSKHREKEAEKQERNREKREREKEAAEKPKHGEQVKRANEKRKRSKEPEYLKEAEKQKQRTRKVENKSQSSSSSYRKLESNKRYIKKIQSEYKKELKRMDIHDRKEPTQSAEQLDKHKAQKLKHRVKGPIGRKVVNQDAQLTESEVLGDFRQLHMRTQQKPTPSTSNEKGQHQPASTLVANDKQTVRIYSSG